MTESAFPTVDDTDWPLFSRLLDEALTLPPDRHAAWLAALGGSAAALRPRLERLLALQQRARDAHFLETLPTLTVAPSTLTDGPRGATMHAADQRVGPWRLLELLGRGGMGEVWLARRDDGAFERDVALKLPRAGTAAAHLAERFARERDILAALEHRHIARFYDAGVSADGTPWIAMERVSGLPITAHVEQRKLDVDARLRLFLQACAAVGHAHRQLVVHCDLKPGNIVVAEDSEIRLLDFGIARLLQGDAVANAEPDVAMTLDYAAPEQLRGEPVGVTTDVYALGVVLYRLLCGHSPHEPTRAGRQALREAILEGVVRPPSARAGDARQARELRGDLDAIVLRALQRSPTERYADVSAFVDDIERHLAARPVMARPATAGYRIGRFLRRNRWPLVAGGATLAALLFGLGVALWQAREARIEAAHSQAMYQFVLGLFNPKGQMSVDGSIADRKVRDVVADAARQAGTALADIPPARERLLMNLTELANGLGLEDTTEQLEQTRLDLARRYHGADSEEALGVMAERIGRLPGMNRHAEGLALGEQALASCARSHCSAATRAALLVATAENGARVHDAPWSQERQQLEEALAIYARASDGREAIPGVQQMLVAINRNTGRLDAARAGAQQALDIVRAQYGEQGWPTGRWKETLSEIESMSGHPERAAQLGQQAVATMDAQWGADSFVSARSRLMLAALLVSSARRAEAVTLIDTAQRALAQPKFESKTYLRDWADEARLTLAVRAGWRDDVLARCNAWQRRGWVDRSGFLALRSCTEWATAMRNADAQPLLEVFAAQVNQHYASQATARWSLALAQAEQALAGGQPAEAAKLLDGAGNAPAGMSTVARARWALARVQAAIAQPGQTPPADLPAAIDAQLHAAHPVYDMEARALLLQARGELHHVRDDVAQACALRTEMGEHDADLWQQRCRRALATF